MDLRFTRPPAKHIRGGTECPADGEATTDDMKSRFLSAVVSESAGCFSGSRFQCANRESWRLSTNQKVGRDSFLRAGFLVRTFDAQEATRPAKSLKSGFRAVILQPGGFPWVRPAGDTHS